MVGGEDFSEKGAFKLSPARYIGVYQVRSGRELTGRRNSIYKAISREQEISFPCCAHAWLELGKPGEWGG